MTERKKRATYEDVLAAPPEKVAEVVDGELYLFPRPAKPHAAAASAIGEELGPPFKRGRGGPGGWILLFEPELHLASDILVPDLGGWRRERMPVMTTELPYFDLAPDWVCEVLSDSTKKLVAAHADDAKVRAEPFDAIELDLSILWGLSGRLAVVAASR